MKEKQLKRIADLLEELLDKLNNPLYSIPSQTQNPIQQFQQYCCDCQNPNTPPYIGDCLCNCHLQLTSTC